MSVRLSRVCLQKPIGSIGSPAACYESCGERGQKATGREGHPWLHPPWGGDLSHRHHQLHAASPRGSKGSGEDWGPRERGCNHQPEQSRITGESEGPLSNGHLKQSYQDISKKGNKQNKTKQRKWGCCSGLTTKVPEIPPPPTGAGGVRREKVSSFMGS